LRDSPCVIQLTRRRRDYAIVPELSGKYLCHYDPRRDFEDCYYLSATEVRGEAKIFANGDEAMKYYLQICPTPIYYSTHDHVSRPLAEEYMIEIVYLPMTDS
jgi:hypothetical protein